jgi:predicted short-subunit dehydrogenase-like oxidoreductase (DUF2520 family)
VSIPIKNIVIAGSGNVAWHLGKALFEGGYSISGIWSRNKPAADELSRMCFSKVLPKPEDIPSDTHLLIIAVSDAAISEVATLFSEFEGIAVHTAGSVGIDVFKNKDQQTGVIYPLQTLSKHSSISLKEVPVFIEGSDEITLAKLHEVAANITSNVYQASSHQRLMLHIAAVFAGNYTNLMYSIADEILTGNNLPYSALHPLIAETAKKAIALKPNDVQTGPARRNDKSTIQKHLKLLEKQPDIALIYQILADTIIKKYNSKS